MAATVVDWVATEWLATRLAGSGDAAEPGLDWGLDELARQAEERVVAYTGLTPVGPLPPPEAIGRREWIQSNIKLTRQLLDPVFASASAEVGKMKPAGKLWLEAVSSFELALMLGFMAQRILGQYEVMLLEQPGNADPPRLLFVRPNLVQTVGKLDVDEHEFVTWVTLHEVTHAVQFGGVPGCRVTSPGWWVSCSTALRSGWRRSGDCGCRAGPRWRASPGRCGTGTWSGRWQARRSAP